VYTFSSQGGDLIAWGAKLRRVGPERFRDLGTGTITFAQDGETMRATLTIDGETFFAGQRVEPPRLESSSLSAFVGKYRSAEIDTSYSVFVTNGNLLLQLKRNTPLNLEPVAGDTFESGALGTLVFDRDATRRVTGFRLYDVSARGVGFERAQ
jgi:hypothetical protein